VDTVYVESFWKVTGSNLNGRKDSVNSQCRVSPPKGSMHYDYAASAQRSIRKQALISSDPFYLAIASKSNIVDNKYCIKLEKEWD